MARSGELRGPGVDECVDGGEVVVEVVTGDAGMVGDPEPLGGVSGFVVQVGGGGEPGVKAVVQHRGEVVGVIDWGSVDQVGGEAAECCVRGARRVAAPRTAARRRGSVDGLGLLRG